MRQNTSRSLSSNPHAANFDILAKPYRWLEYLSFGFMLEHCRYHFLPACNAAQRALILGDGDGRFTQRLLMENSAIEVDAVDASACMLQALVQRAKDVGAEHRGRPIQADIRTWKPEPLSYDLVISHFFLDCLTPKELDSLTVRLKDCVAPEALWLISDFTIPAFGWIRPLARLLVHTLYFAFRLLTKLGVHHLPNHPQILTHRGLMRLQSKTLLGGLLTTELWQVSENQS